MSTYKVIQDIEAEDKLIGPLTLRQFIYAGIAAICLYLTFLSVTKHVPFLAALFMPVAIFAGFFAFPWGKDQPTEVWALAKIRFYLKPRKRIWDQSGAKELVTVTVPKRIQRVLTDGLSQQEVRSRLQALAGTIDSRGWAVKNASLNMATAGGGGIVMSDRLLAPSALPQQVSDLDIKDSDDILDASNNPIAHNFETMITTSSQNRHQQLINQMQQPEPLQVQTPIPPPAQDYYFMNQPAVPVGQSVFVADPVVAPGAASEPASVPRAATPTAEEQAMVEHFKQENSSQNIAYNHLKTVQPLSAQAAAPTPSQTAPPQLPLAAPEAPKPAVTLDKQAAIINLANRNDLNVATLQREADEVVISLR